MKRSRSDTLCEQTRNQNGVKAWRAWRMQDGRKVGSCGTVYSPTEDGAKVIAANRFACGIEHVTVEEWGDLR